MQINDLSFLTRVDDQMKDSFIFIIFNWDCYYFFLFDWNLCEIVEQLDDSYLGCERWLPSRPKVEKPPSVFNAATLAYIDDSIFEILCFLGYDSTLGTPFVYINVNGLHCTFFLHHKRMHCSRNFSMIITCQRKKAFEFYLDFWEPFYFRSLEHT
ncbi:uncharacterized protein LOC18096746 isoform X4 [Populus trichocarpa]|uniref:uncharacterized protein LOC18096746 isoform X4 n=1 Tax=Populus trichocarpa TaxID=3694 RepID=UPI0022790ED3|nr:uncharacterized protein LOC18096746 isoform X4 [Populus trichocarpa]